MPIIDAGVPRSEALPHRSARRRAIRWSVEDRPGADHTSLGHSHAAPAEERRHLPSVLKGVRALVVDDDPDNLEVFSVALAACGALVMTASRAQEAVRVVTTRLVDVVVSDIAMPEGDGYWLIRELRRVPDTRVHRIPVVAVTAYGREHSRERVLAAGFADHLRKPLDPEALCQAVAKAIGH